MGAAACGGGSVCACAFCLRFGPSRRSTASTRRSRMPGVAFPSPGGACPWPTSWPVITRSLLVINTPPRWIAEEAATHTPSQICHHSQCITFWSLVICAGGLGRPRVMHRPGQFLPVLGQLVDDDYYTAMKRRRSSLQISSMSDQAKQARFQACVASQRAKGKRRLHC